MISEAFFVLSEESIKKSRYFICIFWGRVALNLTWVLPSKTPMERPLRGYKNPSKGLRCNSCSRMLGKKFALNTVSPFSNACTG